MPTGDIMQFGSNVAKNTSGYDIKDLVIGSEGTLCIATKLRMRVIPQPKVSYTLLVPYPSLEQCVGTVPKFINSDLNPTAIEYMPKPLLDEAADFSKFAGTKMEETGIRISIQGHAGDGNMHIQLMRDDMDKKLFEERCPKLMAEPYAQAKVMSGQVSGEHGIGHVRVGALETFMGPQMIALYQAIKNAFDEKHILNPGKVIRQN